MGARGVVASGRWNAEVRDRAQQIQRIRPSTDQACEFSTVKEGLKRWPDVFLEVLAQPTECGIPGVERSCQWSVLAGWHPSTRSCQAPSPISTLTEPRGA
jgi:hypothetical protein